MAIISIVMPVKNAMPFLPACVDSILSQTRSDLELIAVDDHSSDRSLEYLIEASKKDERIIVLKNKGEGIIQALKTAYAHSSGNFITRMDADDIMRNDKLAVLYKLLCDNEQKGLAVGQVKYFSENGVGDGYRKYESWLNRLTALGSNFSEIYKECVIPSPAWMVGRKDFDRAGGFDSDIYPEDYDLCFRFYEKGIDVIPCTEKIHLWRDHTFRTSRTSENYRDNRFLALKIHYFLKLEKVESKPLVLWGAGRKGKLIAKELKQREIVFRWLCNNINKIGRDVYGIVLEDSASIGMIKSAQIIVAVANPVEQEDIRIKLNENTSKQSAYFFC